MATAPGAPDPVPLAILAKAPVAGFAKTRLIPRLGPDGAASLQDWMVRRTVATALAANVGPVSLWCAPDREHSLFRVIGRTPGLALHEQAGADLGARMLAAFRTLGADRPMILVGTDCPALTPSHVTTCAAVLANGHDAVFLPVEDGGYALIGLRRPVAAIFEGMTWSTDDVMPETRQRLARLGLSWREPATLWDIDVPADLDRLAELRQQNPMGRHDVPPAA